MPFSITDTNFGQRLAGTVSGSRPYRGGHGGGRGVVYMPYAYPVYVGNYGYGYDQPQQPNVVVVYPQQQQQAPVVINQQFGQTPAQPQDQGSSMDIKVYQAPSRHAQEAAPSPDPGAAGYLLAFNDNSIYSAIAYWVDGDTLHYFTNGNTHNQVSLSLVDRALTERLNRERGVDLRLPAAAK